MSLNYTIRFAIDRKSVRTMDEDGRLHVEITPISKANICPYLGHEIPDSEKMGLEADKVYYLLRDPGELKKAAATFNGIQLLQKHIPVSADDPQKWDTVGCTGTEAEFKEPYLFNSIVVWDQKAIKGIEADTKRELSSAYRYRADMKPGTYKGEKYDGVMRDIVGNHVAIVEEGRAGNDVMVHDSKPFQLKERTMSANKVLLTRKAAMAQGALVGFLKPRLAADALPKINWGKILGAVTTKNFAAKKGAIVAGVKDQIKGKLAKDASVDGLVELLDGLEKVEGGDMDAEPMLEGEPNSALPLGSEEEEESMDADPGENLKSFLASKGMGDDDIAGALDAAGFGGAGDAEAEEPEGVPVAKPGSEKAAEEGEDGEMGGKEDGGKFAAAKDKKAKDEPPPFKGRPEVGGTMTGDQVNKLIKSATEKAVKQANDEADKKIAEARQLAADAREAERFVRPWVGDLAMANDSAEGVYKTALTALGKDVRGVHPSAYKILLENIPQPTAKRQANDAALALDGDAVNSFHKRFPMIERIGRA